MLLKPCKTWESKNEVAKKSEHKHFLSNIIFFIPPPAPFVTVGVYQEMRKVSSW